MTAMMLFDVNVLVYAHREDTDRHPEYRQWLEAVINGDHSYGMSEHVLSGFLRIVTHPRIFTKPSPFAAALAFTEQLRIPAACTLVQPGVRHWDIFVRLCQEVGAKGNMVPDAYFAALAIESGSEWITTDRDY